MMNKVSSVIGKAKPGLKTFDYYSLAYLNQWLDRDRHYVATLNSAIESDKLDTLKKAATFYKVARTLRPNSLKVDSDLDRYKPLLDILDRVAPLKCDECPELLIESINKEITNIYGKHNLYSATTKFLWLKVQSPIFIYDSLTVNALKVKKDQIPDFRAAWQNSFNLNKAEIKEACLKLGDVHQYASDRNVGSEEIESLAQNQWFWERVHDLYLMDLGRT